MSVSYKRQMLSDSIGFNTVTDPKFKTNTINVRFILPISQEHSAGFALAASLLTTSCRKYPSIAALNRKMNRLYGGSAAVDVSKLGDFQIITASFAALCNRYAIDNEDILGELLDVMDCCLFDPNVTGNGFSENEFAIKSKDLLDTIEAEINNKRGYAVKKCTGIAYKDEPSAYSGYGTKEAVLKLTPESTFEAYRKMMSTAAVEIFFVSPEEEPALADKFREMFAKADRKNASALPSFIAPSPLKAEPAELTETLPVAQCKMVMAFKTDCKDVQTMILMNMLYGATPFSKLFANVREKLSLCYYCSSSYSETKQTLIVDCGVLKSNIQTAKAEIIKQLDAVAKGDFSEELLENTRMSAYNSIKTLGDT
ncbi:MAG: insulinase family protein, partial [Ruminococcus sp.]